MATTVQATRFTRVSSATARALLPTLRGVTGGSTSFFLGGITSFDRSVVLAGGESVRFIEGLADFTHIPPAVGGFSNGFSNGFG